MRNATSMVVTVVAMVALVGLGSPREAGAANLKAKIRSKIAQRGGMPGAKMAAAAKARLTQLGASRADKRAHARGRALADVHKTGRTRTRTVGDVLFHPALHGAAAFGGMLLLGVGPQMALIAGGIVYLSMRSAKKTSDGWLALENRSIDVLERDGPEAAKQRFADQGAKHPGDNLRRLQRNRHLRNQHYDD